MDNNIVNAVFGGAKTTKTAPKYQWDYGQILKIIGKSLPEYYEVHFSNEADIGKTKTAIGDESGVEIPDEFFTTGQNIYCWLFLHEGENDGETKYEIVIPIKKRPQPSDDPITPQEKSAVTEAIALLNALTEGIPATINTALEEAKESGIFDGADGADGNDGQDGFSPEATVTKSGNTATITITDISGTTAVTISDGADGTNGADGADGTDGFSPTAAVTKSGNTATITITDKNGTTTATVLDGTNGTNGADGEDGKSAYEIAVDNGFVGTEIEWLDSLKGTNGTNGTDGADGVTFTPSVSASGVISWTNDGNMPNPASVDLVDAVISALPIYSGGVS